MPRNDIGLKFHCEHTEYGGSYSKLIGESMPRLLHTRGSVILHSKVKNAKMAPGAFSCAVDLRSNN